MRLGLGTVQFGVDYGVSNRNGRPGDAELDAILARAASAGIALFDTAPAYGDGIARLAQRWPAAARAEVVSKTPVLGGRPADWANELEASLRGTLDALGLERAYGLLVHRPADLLGEHGPLLHEALQGLVRAGLVERIGLSVYTGEQIDAALGRYPLQLVQAPLNVLDQRLLAGGQLERLAQRGIEVHVRSVFLQGLLLMPPERIPAGLAAARGPLARFRTAAAAHGCTPLEAAVAFGRSLRGVDALIVGVNTAAELDAILHAWRRPIPPIDFAALALNDPVVVDPSGWPAVPA